MGLGDLVRPDLEADQRVRAKGVGNWHISCLTALSDQHAADSRHVIPRIKGVPPPAKIDLEPAGEIHRPIRWRHVDVAEIAGAIACRNVHAAAKGDGEVRVGATDGLGFIEYITGGLGRTRMLVPKNDVAMNEIANRLHAPPSHGRLPEEVPGYFG